MPQRAAAIEAAVRDESQSVFTVPAGTFCFPTDVPVNGAASGLVLRGIRRPANNPFTICADGAVFLFSHPEKGCPSFSRAVHLCDCAHLVPEGELMYIDREGNRIGFLPYPGTLPQDPGTMEAVRSNSEVRIVPQKADGGAMLPLYNVVDRWGPAALWGVELQMDEQGVCWFIFAEDTLMRTIFMPLHGGKPTARRACWSRATASAWCSAPLWLSHRTTAGRSR